MSFNFDEELDRSGTGSEKYDARKRLFGSDDITPLWVADMDFAAPACVSEAIQKRAMHPIYGYSMVPEHLFSNLQRWVAERYDWHPNQDEILLSPGVVPVLYAAVNALTKAGDGIIVMPPVYPPLFKAVSDNQRELILNPLLITHRDQSQSVDKGAECLNAPAQTLHYEIDWDGLELCAKKAKMLLFCSPHNPVGRVWTRSELAQLLDVAERHDLIIISDEIHADLTFVPHTVLATLPGAKKRVITAMAPSKTFNMPGLGLAWLVAPEIAQREAIKEQYAKLAIHVNNPLSMVATEAAYGHGHDWLAALLNYVKITHDEVVARLAEHPQAPQGIAAEGTYLLWLDCRHTGLDDQALQRHFVEKAKLGLSAGVFFGEAGRGFMRVNLAAPRRIVSEAIERLIESFTQPS